MVTRAVVVPSVPQVAWTCPRCKQTIVAAAVKPPECWSGHAAVVMLREWVAHRK